MPEEVKIPENSPLYRAPEGTPMVETPAEPIIPAEPGTPPAEPGTPPAEPAKPYEFAYKPVWERLEKDGIAIPDDFKKGKFPEGKDEYQAFVDLVLENTEFEPENQTATDPFIENYLQVPPEKRDEYIQQYQNAQVFFQLDPEAGLKAWYQAQTVTKDGKEERQYDDATIDKHLETLSPIQKEELWNQKKGIAQKQFDDVYKKGTEQRTQEQAQRTEALNKQHLETAKALGTEIDSMKEFGCVTLTDEVKQSAKRNLILLSQIDPTTGKPHLLNLLNDNKRLMRMVVADTMINGDLVREYITTQNEKFAKVILDEKLEVAPKPKSGTIGQPSGANLPTKA